MPRKISSKRVNTTLLLTESAVMLALSAALFTVSEFIPWPASLQGGGISLFGSLPIIVLSYRRGLKYAIPTAFILSLFELVMGLSNFAWVKGPVSYVIVALFDYILAYTSFGIGGLFRKAKGNVTVKLVAGTVITNAIRFVCHFLSGITVWSEYTQGNSGFTNLDSLIHGITKGSVIYSVTYNGGYMLPETIIAVIGAVAVGIILRKELVRYLGESKPTEATPETAQDIAD